MDEKKKFDLTAETLKIRANIVAQKARAAARPPTLATPGPIQRYLGQNPDLLSWERTLDQLRQLTHIWVWIQKDFGMARRMQLLADRCKNHATQAQHQEYLQARDVYLGYLGELCELFYLQHPSWDVKEIVNLRYQHTRAYLAISQAAFLTHIGTLPKGAICLLVKEWPLWLVASAAQQEDMIKARLVFPDATIQSA